ncbi:Pre-mRNA-splicing factor of RES complex-domain-containing protein [Clohesyomyces aquaticus]|uniref:Pre-mRNA-splicing factor of RES complex-domain-containing protein n=1 Tax=Clohesyomyces aquaticus TaxID=1231657 RepID=A0A1Y1YNF4_9PLEO|nr:Pre-mRNA-splicing factor of RES complex-domain-containing protein [Clohesyomyces aquaticus]
MSLADYLAQKYLTADTPGDKKSKKRKRKNKEDGLKIADDDLAGWSKGQDDDENDPRLVGMPKTSKSKTTWTTFGVAAPSTSTQLVADAEKAAADAILAQAATDRARAAEDEDAAPEVIDTEGVLSQPKMDSGANAGLQTAAQVAAAVAKKREADLKNAAEVAAEAAKNGGSETIYRDASGRIINIAMKRAEARKKVEEEERKAAEKERLARGEVQNKLLEKRKEDLKEAKYLSVARYASDEALNSELKEQDRWNDPAMGFLVKKKAGRSVTGKPLYKGGFTPNRYGIRPGFRWDGVDRGNGFEALWFKARNRKKDRETMEYAWQMDE